jgi:hypothetical protein
MCRTRRRADPNGRRHYRRFQQRPSRFASAKRRCTDRRLRRRKSPGTPKRMERTGSPARRSPSPA